MKTSQKSLDRLISRAREASVETQYADESFRAPPGFVTRVVAQARLPRREGSQPWWQMLGVAVAWRC
ncbi:MAG: hypothetical protein J6386_16525 [Candidatus Synoicihabitans palmerolidicus]|nr:hypothetical protein [Candidatus Synoicihabitans palmerolidicus]